MEESAFESVPGSPARGRMETSSAAWDGNSAAGRTSIGPETDTSDEDVPRSRRQLLAPSAQGDVEMERQTHPN